MCPDRRRAQCQRCGRHRNEAGSISWEGLCRDCAMAAVGQNIAQMMDRRGPNFDTWRRSMVLCAYPELLDALESKP
jgi:hypothetical protein